MKTYNFASFFFSRNFLLNDLNLKYVYSYTNNNNEHASNREKFEWGGLVMLVKTEGTLSFVHACSWPKKTWPHDAQEIVRHMMACFGLYFQVIIFDQFLLLLLDMFISIVFKNTESDLDFKALYGIITLPK